MVCAEGGQVAVVEKERIHGFIDDAVEVEVVGVLLVY